MATYPDESVVKDGVVFGPNDNDYEGTMPPSGGVSRSATLAKETGANARGGIGTCAKLSPTSDSTWGYWWFYLPTEGQIPIRLSFWHKVSAGFTGQLKVTIFDTDDVDRTDKLLDAEVVTLYDDATYHQHLCANITPMQTGLCLVRIEVIDGSGAGTGDIFIDDFGLA